MALISNILKMRKKITNEGFRVLYLAILFILPLTYGYSQSFDCPADITVTAVDNGGVCTAAVSLIATNTTGCAPDSPTNDSPFAVDNNSLDASGDYPVGTTTVIFTDCGGTETCMVDVTVEKPAPTCTVQDITAYLDATGVASILAADVDNGSVDPCGGLLTLSVSPSSFSCANIGANVVNFTATNDENTMCVTTANVTVLDTVPPVFVPSPFTVYLDEDGLGLVTGENVAGLSTDNCTDVTIVLLDGIVTCDDVSDGASLDLSLIDDNGNTTEATAMVTVLDTIAPVVDPVEDIDVTLDPSNCVGPVSYEIPEPVDNCDIPVTLTQNLNPDIIQNSVSCPSGSMVHYYRIFDGSTFPFDIDVTSVEIGVAESFNSPSVTVNIHELNGDFTMANLTQIATNTMVLGDLSLEFVDFPIAFTLSNAVYVVEIIAPNSNDNGFIVGTNSAGETMPSYYTSLACGVPEPITIAEVGFPNNAVLMSLTTTNSVIVEQTEGIASDSIFPMGTTTNVFEYTDASGNVTELSFDVNVEEFPVAGLSCLTDLNLSIDSEICESSLTPEMLLTTELIGCPDDCEIIVLALDEDIELPNLFTADNVGESYRYQVSCGGNSCWGYVHVEDKTPPQIICSNDTLSCGEFLVFPFPEAVENCTEVLFFTLLNETITDVSCDDPELSQIITREFVAEDAAGNVSNVCSQLLSISKFDIGTVEPPLNTFIPIECGTTFPTDDQGRPDVNVFGGPILNGTDLIQDQAIVCNLFVDFEDQVIPYTPTSFSIVRTFRAIHWECGQDTMATFVQVFEIGDNLGPVITCSPDLTFSANSLNCGSSIELPMLEIEDICGDVGSVQVQYDGGFIDGNGGIADLPLGTSSVTYTASDQVGNLNTCTFDVTVVDDVQPIPVCDQFTTISLTNEGLAIVDAEEFDDGSFDACGPITLTVRRMVPNCDPNNVLFGESVTFCCEDLGTEQMVVLRVTDANGNFNECMVFAEVQDKTPPSLIQGLPDITVACDFPFDAENLDQFGTIQTTVDAVEEIVITSDLLEFSGPAFDGLVLGGCLELISDEFVSDNLNSCGQGTATRIITFTNTSGLTVTDIQQISFVNPDPFDEDDVQFPADITLSNICDPALVPVTMPIFVEDVCDQVGIEIDDQVVDNSNGSSSCFKVIRTFTLVDWCQSNNPTFDFIIDQQIIEVINTIAPVITSDCSDITQCSFDTDCGDSFIELILEAEDDCTTAEFLNYNYLIDAFSDGSIDFTGNTANASNNYPVGVHTIYWNVNDACGNEDVCSYTFEIQNCTVPSPKCLDNLTVGLTPWDTDGDGEVDMEKAIVTPDFFDAGSSHACGTAIQLSFSPDVNDVEREFSCEDIGEQAIQLWVTDENGNQDFCTTSLIVQDNNDVNICPDMLFFNISGTVKSETDIALEDVVVTLGLPDLQSITDENGNYGFTQLPNDMQYNIELSNNLNPTQGITVSDIILIQKHILGLQPLDSPYKLLAADVDNSSKVNGQDIIQIRKLLLGHYDNFPLNESWRYVDAEQTFIDPANPWFNDINENVHIQNLGGNVVADFIGLKVGDVNQTAANGFGHDIDTRSGNEAEFTIDAIDIKAGTVGEIRLENNDDRLLEGLQLGLDYDENAIEVMEVRIGGQLASEAQYKMNESGMRLILTEEEIAQDIVFVVRANRDLSSSTFILNDEVFVNMAYAQNEGEIAVVLREEREELNEEFSFSLDQNEPNPWMNLTNIYFTSPSSQQGVFKVFDANGRVHVERTIAVQKGQNNVVLYNNELPASGVYYYEVSFGAERHMKKMILIK